MGSSPSEFMVPADQLAHGTEWPSNAFLVWQVMMQVEVGGSERIAGARLEELYAAHAPDALRLAYLMTGDRAQAEDLVQDAFVKVAGRFVDLRDPSGFGLYLRRTVVNLANSWFRRRKVERTFLERESSRATPVTDWGDVALRHELWRVLLSLPSRQRAALVLRYYEDRSETQIADVLGCRPGTVKSLLSRGLQSLRVRLVIE